MSEWKKVKFLDLFALPSRNGLTKPSRVRGSGYKMINMGELFSNGRIYDIPMELVPLNDKEKEVAKVERYDLLFARQSLVLEGAGKCSIVMDVSDLTTFESHLIRVRLDYNIANPLFYYYYFSSSLSPISSIVSQCAQAGIKGSDLVQIMVDFPPLHIQQRIATILSRYDSLIENYQKQIKLLEESAQRLYKEWFIDLRFPGHENTKIVDGVPEGWEKKTIDDVTCKVTTGLNPRKNFVLGKGSNYYVTIKNMADNTLFLDDRCDRVDNEALEKINKRSDLKIGDILFSGIGTIGRVALVDIPTNNWNVSESVFTLRVNDIVTKEFLYLMLLNPDMQNYCQSNAHGAAQKGIRMADLKAYSFNLPPFGVIQKFTNSVTPTIKKVSSIRNQIRHLTEARDRLLPKLMSGEIEFN